MLSRTVQISRDEQMKAAKRLLAGALQQDVLTAWRLIKLAVAIERRTRPIEAKSGLATAPVR